MVDVVEGVKLPCSPSMAVTLGVPSIARIETAKSNVNCREMSMAERGEERRGIREVFPNFRENANENERNGGG